MTLSYTECVEAAYLLIDGGVASGRHLAVDWTPDLEYVDAKQRTTRHAEQIGRPLTTGSVGRDAKATLVAALIQCEHCDHLNGEAIIQPSIVRLPLRRIDCAPCSTTTAPTRTAGDQCDLCETAGITEFWPVTAQFGYYLFIGDACARCTVTLGPKLTG